MSRPMKILLGAVVLVLAALGIAQIVLPILAAKALRAKVARYGEVEAATVSATPAIELLWGSAGSAEVKAGRLAISPEQIVELLLESRSVSDLSVSARSVEVLDPGFGAKPLVVTDVKLSKRGSVISASALLSRRHLGAALPVGLEAEVLEDAKGGVAIRAKSDLLGFNAHIDGLISPSEGRVRLSANHPLLAGLGKVTLFANPKVHVTSLSAQPEQRSGNGGPAGGSRNGAAGVSSWRLSVEAELR